MQVIEKSIFYDLVIYYINNRKMNLYTSLIKIFHAIHFTINEKKITLLAKQTSFNQNFKCWVKFIFDNSQILKIENPKLLRNIN
jgi:hypothetical protein